MTERFLQFNFAGQALIAVTGVYDATEENKVDKHSSKNLMLPTRENE